MRSVYFILLTLFAVSRDTRAEDMYNYQDVNGDDGNGYDEGYDDGNDYQQAYNNNGGNNYNSGSQVNSGEYIQYWTEYAILPKRCIR